MSKTIDRDPRVERDGREGEHATPAPLAPFDRAIGRTRFVVLLGVAAVLLVSMALFVLGAFQAAASVWQAVQSAARGELGSTDVTVQLLEVVSMMLKAVIFYIVGVGLYSLFIGPLNVTTALGVDSLNDLEEKVISVVIVIMAVTFLEHFITWQQPTEMLQFGASLALVVAALVLFQFHSHRAGEKQKHDDPALSRAQRALFEKDEESREVRPEDAKTPGARSDGDER
ncbi:MAG: YqhA family protein [Chloroflexi bacterium]|nr:YqhA family protein [Chloroflexota bacterium]